MFMVGSGLDDRTLGIVEFGRIGQEVARLAAGFGMRVIYTDVAPRRDSEYEHLSLEPLLGEADIVTLHCPLTPETHLLIGERDSTPCETGPS
jgi:glyoxylate reductase